jgi:hypothetical protein
MNVREGNEQRAETCRVLRQLCRGTGRPKPRDDRPRLSMGIPSLDRLLPHQGLVRGSLVEWLVPVDGSGAGILALQAVRAALDPAHVWAVVDPTGEFHAPAVQGWGISLESLLLVRTSSMADSLWTVEQCLRCPGIGITWFHAEHLSDRVVQRWNLAVEVGGGVGVLFRPARAAHRASWADVRWQVHPRLALTTGGHRVRVELLVCRDAFAGGCVELDVNDATGDVCLVSAVAGATTTVPATGA